MTNFGKTVRKRLIDLDKTQDWLAAQVEGTGIPCDKTYLSKILNGAQKGKQVKAAIEKILDLEGCKLAYHISILIIPMGYQDIFQLIIITDLKVLKSLDKLAVRLGFYKSLDICRLDLKIRKGRRKYLAVCVNDTKFRP